MIRILFLATNPIDQVHLHIHQEFDELRRALDTAEHGKRFVLIPKFAIAVGQLQELLFRHKPQIIHFSGHGGKAGKILFEGADGASHPVSTQALHNLFAQFSQIAHCVVLNACYSRIQATAIAAVIDNVLGMSDAVTAEAALNFDQYYRNSHFSRLWLRRRSGFAMPLQKAGPVARFHPLASLWPDPLDTLRQGHPQ